MINYDNKGEVLMLFYGGEQGVRGISLLKNPEGTKLWNNRDIRKSIKSGFIKGYDFNQKLIFMRSDCAMSMYLVPKKEFEERVRAEKESEERVREDNTSEGQFAEPNVMFG